MASTTPAVSAPEYTDEEINQQVKELHQQQRPIAPIGDSSLAQALARAFEEGLLAPQPSAYRHADQA